MEREAKTAAARQAAQDKYQEVIAAANKEATAKENASTKKKVAALAEVDEFDY